MFRIAAHNREVKTNAEFRAAEMEMWPSPLEQRMKTLLDSWGIEYKQQEIFYIYAEDRWIIRYYIADFYIPSKKIIIEVDGKFHQEHKQHDKMRTRTIQEQYPGVEVLRYTWKDLSDSDKMDKLLYMIK